MSVFKWAQMESLRMGLASIRGLYVSRTALVLTPDEFVDAFIGPGVYAKLKEVEELVGKISMSPNMDTHVRVGIDEYKVMLGFGTQPPCLVPRSARLGLAESASPAVRTKIETYLSERFSMGCMLGDAYEALHVLNELCADVKAFKTLLPALPAIMGMTEAEGSALDKRAKKLHAARGVGEIPRLPREVKARLQEISAVINGLALLVDTAEPVLQEGYTRFATVTARRHGRVESIFDGVNGRVATASWL